MTSSSHRSLALITGGSRGLGRAAALALAARSVDLIITYRDREAEAAAVVAQAEQAGVRAAALPLDVADASSFPVFAERVKALLASRWQRERFDYLVNNAGFGANAPLADTSEDVFDELFRVHLKAPYFLTQRLLPLIADGGRVLNVSTGLTRFTLPGYSAYASMKGGVEVLTRYMAREFGSRGISVNAIAPGATATDFSGGAVRDNAQLNAHLASQTALGRVGLPDDIGQAISNLLRPESAWMTGQRIEASGGQSL